MELVIAELLLQGFANAAELRSTSIKMLLRSSPSTKVPQALSTPELPMLHTIRASNALPSMTRACLPISHIPKPTPLHHTSIRTAYTIKFLDLPPPSQKPPRPNKYELAYKKSIEDPKTFWGDNAKEEIHW